MSETTILPSARLQELLPQLGQASARDGEAYLRFQLLEETAVLMPMSQIRETLLVPTEQITPIPNLPEFVIGLMSSRDSVFGVIDLLQTLHANSVLGLSSQYQLIVANVQASTLNEDVTTEMLLGFAVRQILGVIRFPEQLIQPPGEHCDPLLQPYVRGIVADGDDPLLILDAQRIGASMPLSI